ncbi:Transforming growth factor beta regulator 4 [Macaca fascicularis]|uniref:FAST kinase domain-containing protein 4 n=1 Tax=Macaca fascicularis TaxID=9541 RepID=G7P1T5_MACFA|nr:Transforming growth factor beta regulator 4 [Macaca fascicularis]
MAAHLVKRCTCLLREAARQAPVMAPVGRLRLARVAHKTLTSSATSPISHFPGSLVELVEKEQAFTPYIENQVDHLIKKAARPEELLELLGGSHHLDNNHAALVLIRLSHLLSEKPKDKALLIQDARFQQLLCLLNSQVWHGTLSRLLRSLYALGLPRTSKELQSVEQEVRWRMRKLKYKHLAFLADSCATLSQEQHSQELLTELLMHLERRWTEIEDGRTLVTIMMKVGHLSEPLMNRLEDKGKLGFHQTQVSQRLAADLLSLMPSLTSGEVARCAKSFALLKWLNLPLYEAFAQHVLNRAQDITVPHLCSVLLAFARLNFHPDQEDEFFSLVHEKLGSELPGLEPALQVDLVWALCVLQQAREAELQAVLHPEFHIQFLGGKSQKDQNTFQKLLHINATAMLEHPEYSGPLLPASAVAPRPSALDRKVTPLQKELQETLKGLLGSADRGSLEVATQYGWVLDAEVLLDSDGQFLPVRDFVAPHLAQPTGSQPPPAGAKRRWEFPNFSTRSKDLLGRFVLARRHILAAGFLIVDVPFYEWLELKSEWQKGAYLKDKMRKAVAEELAK